jgi:hypothetical protein
VWDPPPLLFVNKRSNVYQLCQLSAYQETQESSKLAKPSNLLPLNHCSLALHTLVHPIHMSSPFPLPPSSVPNATSPADDEGNSLPIGRGNNLPILDPLGFTSNQTGNLSSGIIPGVRVTAPRDDEAEEEGTARRGGRRRLREDLDNVPRVKDTTGEKVMERFASFLERSVITR